MLEYLEVDFGGEDGKVVCLGLGQLIAEKITGSTNGFHEKNWRYITTFPIAAVLGGW